MKDAEAKKFIPEEPDDVNDSRAKNPVPQSGEIAS